MSSRAQSRDGEASASLEALGFTALEARIYVDLLRSGPQTGYRIAQNVGKATANTYKALEALAQRGVVACEDGPTRLYRATPYDEVAATLAGDFAERTRRAQESIAALDQRRTDDRIYRVHGTEQIYERARAMLASAKSHIVIDAFPEALEIVKSELAAAASRGVSVSVHAYVPVHVKDARVVVAPNGALARARWPGVWLNLSADGNAALIAHVLDDERTTAVWTENPYVSWTLYCGLASETALAALGDFAARNPEMRLSTAMREIAAIVSSDVPGRVALVSSLKKKKGRSK